MGRPRCQLPPGLPPRARPERRRRRAHRHARPLARHRRRAGLPGRQGRLCREADLADRARGTRDGGRPRGKHNRIVQVGTQHRSAPHFRKIAEIIQRGDIGPVKFVRVWNYVNQWPNGIGRKPEQDPPAGLDWDMYLGPSTKVAFNPNRFLSTFRYFWDYSGGYITDFGNHRLDTMQQIMGVTAPRTVSASGGKTGAERRSRDPRFPDRHLRIRRLHRHLRRLEPERPRHGRPHRRPALL